LIEAAKADAPSTTARAKVWGMLSNTVGAGVAAGGAASMGLGGLATTKLLVAGTLLGGSITVGLAGAAVVLRTPSTPAPALVHVVGAAAEVSPRDALEPVLAHRAAWLRAAPPGDEAGESSRTREIHPAAAAPGLQPALRARAHAEALHALHATAAPPTLPAAPAPAGAHADDLDREAWLLDTARTALSRGDAAGALRAVHATLGLRDRQLVPEELAIEAQALRALGRTDESKAVEDRLRTKFPDSALAR
jgi:hypothetical protein